MGSNHCRFRVPYRRVMGLLLIFFLIGSLHGELRIVERDSFSEDSVNLSFSGFPLEHVQPEGGPEATDFLIDWGIRITGSDGFSSKLDSWGAFPINVLPIYYIVATVQGDDSGPDPVLIVDSSLPLNRIGLWLISNESSPLTLTAQDSTGTQLGVYERAMPGGGIYVAFEDAQGTPISRVLIDYGSGEPEKLDRLQLEYVERPVFRSYIAHMGDGVLPDGESFTSSIVVSNLSNSTAEGQIEFFDDQGERLFMEIGEGIWQDRINLEIPARGSRRWATAGRTTAVRSGSAHISSNVPVAAGIRFSNFDADGDVIVEAGIAAGRAEPSLVVPVGRRVTPGLVGGGEPSEKPSSTAIAIANPSDEPVEVSLLRTGGHESVSLTLPPRGHLAEFLEELFPEIADSDFDGTIRIYASQPVAVTTLHTREGRAHASLPAAGRQ